MDLGIWAWQPYQEDLEGQEDLPYRVVVEDRLPCQGVVEDQVGHLQGVVEGQEGHLQGVEEVEEDRRQGEEVGEDHHQWVLAYLLSQLAW